MPTGTRSERELAGSDALRAWRDDLRTLSRAAREGLGEAEPSPAVEASLRAAAAAQARRGRPIPLRVYPVWSPALAAAALLAVLLGAWFVILPQGNGRERRVQAMRALLTAAEVDATGATGAAEVPAATDVDAGLRALAYQLLQLEGFAAESDSQAADIDWTEFDATEAAARPPTASPRHSSPVFRAQRYG